MTSSSAVCIITSSGMKCLSSPIKEHFPGRKACRVKQPASAAVMRLLSAVKRELARADVKAGSRDVIAAVVELMLDSHVDQGKPFTIVKMGASHSRA